MMRGSARILDAVRITDLGGVQIAKVGIPFADLAHDYRTPPSAARTRSTHGAVFFELLQYSATDILVNSPPRSVKGIPTIANIAYVQCTAEHCYSKL